MVFHPFKFSIFVTVLQCNNALEQSSCIQFINKEIKSKHTCIRAHWWDSQVPTHQGPHLRGPRTPWQLLNKCRVPALSLIQIRDSEKFTLYTHILGYSEQGAIDSTMSLPQKRPYFSFSVLKNSRILSLKSHRSPWQWIYRWVQGRKQTYQHSACLSTSPFPETPPFPQASLSSPEWGSAHHTMVKPTAAL